jgi:hypothetical protein
MYMCYLCQEYLHSLSVGYPVKDFVSLNNDSSVSKPDVFVLCQNLFMRMIHGSQGRVWKNERVSLTSLGLIANPSESFDHDTH